eukprot:5015561-Pleurochrysis_carterae.AAC.1
MPTSTNVCTHAPFHSVSPHRNIYSVRCVSTDDEDRSARLGASLDCRAPLTRRAGEFPGRKRSSKYV